MVAFAVGQFFAPFLSPAISLVTLVHFVAAHTTTMRRLVLRVPTTAHLAASARWGSTTGANFAGSGSTTSASSASTTASRASGATAGTASTTKATAWHAAQTPAEALGLPSRLGAGTTPYTPAEIKAAYKRTAKAAHPDVETGSEAWFRHVQAAYSALQKDPKATRITNNAADATAGSATSASHAGAGTTAQGGSRSFYDHPHNPEWRRQQWEFSQQQRRAQAEHIRRHTRSRVDPETSRVHTEGDAPPGGFDADPAARLPGLRGAWARMKLRRRMLAQQRHEMYGRYQRVPFWHSTYADGVPISSAARRHHWKYICWYSFLVFMLYRAYCKFQETCALHDEGRRQGYPKAYWDKLAARDAAFENSAFARLTAPLVDHSGRRQPEKLNRPIVVPQSLSSPARPRPVSKLEAGKESPESLARRGYATHTLPGGSLPPVGAGKNTAGDLVVVHRDAVTGEPLATMRKDDYNVAKTFGALSGGVGSNTYQYNGYAFSPEGVAAARRARQEMRRNGGRGGRPTGDGTESPVVASAVLAAATAGVAAPDFTEDLTCDCLD